MFCWAEHFSFLLPYRSLNCTKHKAAHSAVKISHATYYPTAFRSFFLWPFFTAGVFLPQVLRKPALNWMEIMTAWPGSILGVHQKRTCRQTYKANSLFHYRGSMLGVSAGEKQWSLCIVELHTMTPLKNKEINRIWCEENRLCPQSLRADADLISRAGALLGFPEKDSKNIGNSHTCTDESWQRGGDKKHNLFMGLWEAPSWFISWSSW